MILFDLIIFINSDYGWYSLFISSSDGEANISRYKTTVVWKHNLMSIRWFISNETSSHTPQYGPSGDFALNSEGPFRLLGNAVAATVGFMFSSNPKLLTELDLYHFCQQQTWPLSNTNSPKHTPANTYSCEHILLQTLTPANTYSRKHGEHCKCYE